MKQTQTGFLEDYDALEEANDREVWGVPDDILLERTPALEAAIAGGGIDALVVDRVVYRPREGAKYVMDAEAAESLEDWSTDKLREVLAREFEIIDEPRPGAARVRLAITDVNPSSVWVNVVGIVLVVPPDMGGVSGEMEIVDAETGERLVAMTATREGTPFLLIECFIRHGHACHGVKKWAAELSRLMRGE